MQKYFFVLMFSIGLFLISCNTGIKTRTHGQENESYLEFIGNPDIYPNGVEVRLDDDIQSFKAEVIDDNEPLPKGKLYAIKPGKYTITVTNNNKTIYKKQIFVSVQETKKIELP